MTAIRPVHVDSGVVYHIELDHSIDAAHRVVGHQGKCRRLHGHTYNFHVEVETPALDQIGFVVDFGVIKDVLNAWDHRCLLWEQDPLCAALLNHDGLVQLSVNPTSENLSRLAAEEIGAGLPLGSAVLVVASETPKSSSRWHHVVHHRELAAV